MHSTNRWHCGGQPARRLQTSPVILFTCVLLAVSFFASKDVEAAALPSDKYHAPSYGSGVIHRGTFHVPEKEDPTEYIEDNSELKKAGAHTSKKVLILGHDNGYSNAKKPMPPSNYFNGYPTMNYGPIHPVEHDPVHFIDQTKYGHAAPDGYASTGKKIPLPLGSPGYGSYDVFGGYIPHSAHHNAHGYDKLLESTYSGHGIHGHLPIKPEAYGYGGLPGYHGADHFGDVDHLHSHKYPIDSKSSLSGYDIKGEYGYGSKLKTDDIALGGYDYANGKLAKPFNPSGAYNSYYGSLDFQDNHGYDNDYNGYYKMHLSYGPLEHHDILANKKLDFYGHFIHPENWESYKL